MHLVFTDAPSPTPVPNFPKPFLPISPECYSSPKRIEGNGYATFWG